jgi:hypothetical protein
MAYTTHDHWTKVFQVGLAQGFQICDIFKNLDIFRRKKKLVEFTLNIKHTKNPHENILKTKQHLGIH